MNEGQIIVSYEKIRIFFNLDEREKQRDLLILQSSQKAIENYLDRKLCLNEYICIQTIKNQKIILEELNPIKIDRMLDLSAREVLVTECSLKGQNVFFSNLHLENHEALIRYNAGFTEENLPADLEECIMNVFMHKSEVLRKRIKGGFEANEYSILNNLKIPEDVKEILEPYRRKLL